MGISPGEGPGNPLQYSCLENSHGQRSMAGYSPRGHKESDVIKRQSTPLTPCPKAFSPTLPLAWIYGSWTPLHTSDLNPLQDITLLPALVPHSLSYHTPLPAQTNTTSPQSHQPASGKQVRSAVGRGQSIYTPEKAVRNLNFIISAE